jgi:N-acetylmuramoyl-L-alanine amidase
MTVKLAHHKAQSLSGSPIPFSKSPNIGGELIPKYLVIHFTAGQSGEAAVNWLCRKDSKASAHVVIDRDGKITQLIPFNRVAFHAGASSWEGLTGLNQYSIGVELDNAGRLSKVGTQWQSWFGRMYPAEEVVEATHKNDSRAYGWHAYTDVQIQAALDLAIVLFKRYQLLDVVGHDDISPRRKWDPGPAFPMDSFRSKLLGRMELHPPGFATIRDLFLRSGPSHQHPLLDSRMARDTKVEVLSTEGMWSLIDPKDRIEGDEDTQGWVLSRDLRRLE